MYYRRCWPDVAARFIGVYIDLLIYDRAPSIASGRRSSALLNSYRVPDVEVGRHWFSRYHPKSSILALTVNRVCPSSGLLFYPYEPTTWPRLPTLSCNIVAVCCCLANLLETIQPFARCPLLANKQRQSQAWVSQL